MHCDVRDNMMVSNFNISFTSKLKDTANTSLVPRLSLDVCVWGGGEGGGGRGGPGDKAIQTYKVF